MIYFLQEIKRFPIAQLKAKGQVVRKLSLNKGQEGDLEIIKIKYNLLNEAASPNVATKKPIQKSRRNLEQQESLLFSSWQSDQSPILPAIYAEPNKGGIRIWLHVPTISERVNFGSKLDEWIKKRSNSICYGKSWHNLLSEKLNHEAILFKFN